jgi:hypothetical protein
MIDYAAATMLPFSFSALPPFSPDGLRHFAIIAISPLFAIDAAAPLPPDTAMPLRFSPYFFRRQPPPRLSVFALFSPRQISPLLPPIAASFRFHGFGTLRC